MGSRDVKSQLNVPLTVQVQSQDGVRDPHVLMKKDRAEADVNLRPSVYRTGLLPWTTARPNWLTFTELHNCCGEREREREGVVPHGGWGETAAL